MNKLIKEVPTNITGFGPIRRPPMGRDKLQEYLWLALYLKQQHSEHLSLAPMALHLVICRKPLINNINESSWFFLHRGSLWKKSKLYFFTGFVLIPIYPC
jgi:hypothetical protein